MWEVTVWVVLTGRLPRLDPRPAFFGRQWEWVGMACWLIKQILGVSLLRTEHINHQLAQDLGIWL